MAQEWNEARGFNRSYQGCYYEPLFHKVKDGHPRYLCRMKLLLMKDGLELIHYHCFKISSTPEWKKRKSFWKVSVNCTIISELVNNTSFWEVKIKCFGFSPGRGRKITSGFFQGMSLCCLTLTSLLNEIPAADSCRSQSSYFISCSTSWHLVQPGHCSSLQQPLETKLEWLRAFSASNAENKICAHI